MQIMNQMKLQFLSVPENESFARVAVSAFAVQLDPTLDVLADIKTAVSEAVTNAIVHGYGDKIGWVTLEAAMTENGVLSLIIGDQGKGIADVAQAMHALFYHPTGKRTLGHGLFCDADVYGSGAGGIRPGGGHYRAHGKAHSARLNA